MTDEIEEWPQSTLYHCGQRMAIDRSMPVERDDDGRYWRQRYWRCRAPGCVERGQTCDEVHACEFVVVRERTRGASQEGAAAAGQSARRVQELRKRRRFK